MTLKCPCLQGYGLKGILISYVAAQCECSEDAVYANCDADWEMD